MQPSADEQLNEALGVVPLLVSASREAYGIFHDARAKLATAVLGEHQCKLIALGIHADRTSQAIEKLRSEGFWLQALALLRVRLEETIVCSYLIHQNSDELYNRYFEFGPIADYRSAKAVMAQPALAPHVTGRLDLDALAAEAADIERAFNPGFDITKGKFKAKWTELDLHSMATKRDQLADAESLTPSAVPLAPLYVGMYRTASAVIHGDASVISSPFTGAMVGADGIPREARLFWEMSIPAYLSACDIVQAYEIVAACGLDCEGQFLGIIAKLT